ncbi:MAG: NADH-quinone oxidoreductase subunit D [Muribaculaceae bacterium]|nr:NADH-quinone oxidoreductase subunit D [Muribaculaceae bacterium]
MEELQNRIASQFPQATFEAGEYLLVNIDDAHWHALAAYLRDNERFDYLISIVGQDWNDAFGCVYYLTNTFTRVILSVKVTTTDRENPMLHSVSDLWAVAGIYEREVYDFYGIIFINNPDMRRIFLRADWNGHPLRKDYDASPEANPVPTENEETDDTTVAYVENEKGEIVKEERVVFAPEEFVVNIGPQHPATHGVLRLRTSLDGEFIKKIDLYLGYVHRGIEKLCEGLAYPQMLHFADRLDYLSAHQNRHCFCLCIEKALGLEVPRRAQVIRVIMDELMRISSHMLFAGTFCMDLGATTMLFYTLREREKILNIFERTCGARMTYHYNVIGGVAQDLHPDFVKDVKAFLPEMRKSLKEYHTLFTGNVITEQRMIGVGPLSREDAISYGISGPSGRASGWANDIRKTHPYSIYSELDFEQVVRTDGDSFGRWMVRMDEVLESIKIIEQLIDNIPEGEICAPTPKVMKLPAGHWFQQVEASRGAIGFYIESDGGTTPVRVKINSPCFPLAGIVDHLTRGAKIADLITIGGSLDYVVPDIDR